MKKKKRIIIGSSIGVIFLLILLCFGVQYLRVKFAKIEVVLTDDLTLEFASKKYVSDYIISINGKLLDDYEIDATSL